MGIDELVPDSIRPRHAEYRQAFAREPRARPMGKQTDLVARRKDGTEVVVEIALSPLQDHGHPLVVAAIRDIGAYPRMKQALLRAHYSEVLARVGRLAVDTRDPQVLLDRVPAAASEALQVELAMVYLLEPSLLELRIAGGVGSMPGEAIGQRVANRPDTSLGFVLAQGRPIVVRDYRQETRFNVPAAYLKAGLISAVGVPLSDRGRTIGVLVVRSRVAAQLRRGRGALSRIARQSADERAAAGAVGGGAQSRAAARERGSAHRRHRPRLQQPADGDPGQPAGARRAAGRRRRAAAPPARRCRLPRLAPRRRAHRQAARVFAPPGAAAARRGCRGDAAFARRHAAANARPADPHRGRDPARRRRGARRPGTARVGPAQHRDQCARRHAGRRHASLPGRVLRHPAGNGRCRGGRGDAGRSLRGDRDRRQRHRHDQRSAGARVRALLHHQGGGPRHRPRPEHRVRIRPPVPGRGDAREHARPRHDRHALPASAAGRAVRAAARCRVRLRPCRRA